MSFTSEPRKCHENQFRDVLSEEPAPIGDVGCLPQPGSHPSDGGEAELRTYESYLSSDKVTGHQVTWLLGGDSLWWSHRHTTGATLWKHEGANNKLLGAELGLWIQSVLFSEKHHRFSFTGPWGVSARQCGGRAKVNVLPWLICKGRLCFPEHFFILIKSFIGKEQETLNLAPGESCLDRRGDTGREEMKCTFSWRRPRNHSVTQPIDRMSLEGKFLTHDTSLPIQHNIAAE